MTSVRGVTTEGADRAPAGLGVEVAERVVQDLFAVGLDLAVCRAAVDGPVRDRLDAAAADVDRIVRDLRLAVFDGREQGAPKGAGCSDHGRFVAGAGRRVDPRRQRGAGAGSGHDAAHPHLV